MDIEVVAAGVAANELRDDGDDCGEQNECGPVSRRRSWLRSLLPVLFPVPCSFMAAGAVCGWFAPRRLPE